MKPRASDFATLADFWKALAAWEADGEWVPASGGTETPFLTKSGRRLLYCWNKRNGDHRYLDCDSDIILSDEEARLALGTY